MKTFASNPYRIEVSLNELNLVHSLLFKSDGWIDSKICFLVEVNSESFILEFDSKKEQEAISSLILEQIILLLKTT